jgi:hypothetical protein
LADVAMLVEWGAWIICTTIASIAMLKAWNGWLEVKKLELRSDQSLDVESPAGRIALADLRQRLRRLEAIAEGIDIPDARR